MSMRLLAAAAIIGLILGGAGERNPAAPTTVASATGQDLTTTLEDQSELALTVYNSDLALVRDVRALQLTPGTSNLRFMDIAATVNPATVHFRSLSNPNTLNVLEQNYEYDLLEPDKLLRKYVGRDVTLVRTSQRDGSTREEEVKARLLSYNSAPVWQIGSDIVTGLHADHIRFPQLPDSLYSRPTLIWSIENSGPARQRVEASYLAGKLSWNADYVLRVGRDDKLADLDGWVTLVIGSGTSFRQAKLELVAGDLNRVRNVLASRVAADEVRALKEAASPMAQESFSDYHLYTLARKTTINNNQTKQVSMLEGTDIPVRKRYVVDGHAFYYRNAQHPGSPIKDRVEVYYQFKNEQRGGLGVPMPAGVVRVYQDDSKGGLQFVGEDRIDHTPKGETLNLKIGNAFDVVAERKQIDFEKIASGVYEVEYEVALRNHKTVPVSVDVNEPIGGTWRILRSTHEWTKSEAWADCSALWQAANWLVKSLHQRATTILKVATEIVSQQEGFFRRGVQALRPLILRDIADAIGMHESTISRVTTNKYMATPRGLLELKYFFTSSIAASHGGESHSAEAVRFRIRGLIDGEPSSETLSDERIVELLQEEGVEIARRTVAKYREAMRIPSSVQRRREKISAL